MEYLEVDKNSNTAVPQQYLRLSGKEACQYHLRHLQQFLFLSLFVCVHSDLQSCYAINGNYVPYLLLCYKKKSQISCCQHGKKDMLLKHKCSHNIKFLKT